MMKSTNPESVVCDGSAYLVHKSDKGLAIRVVKVVGDRQIQVWKQFAFTFKGLASSMPTEAVKAILLCDMN